MAPCRRVGVMHRQVVRPRRGAISDHRQMHGLSLAIEPWNEWNNFRAHDKASDTAIAIRPVKESDIGQANMANLLTIVRSLVGPSRRANAQALANITGSDDDPRDASGGNALTGRVKAPVNTDRRPIQKARDRFPGAGSILATMDICR